MKRISLILLGLSVLSCKSHLAKSDGMTFPDVISPIYFLDTIQIPDPIIIKVDMGDDYISEMYITTRETLNEFTTIDEFLEKKEVVRFLDFNLGFDRSVDHVFIYKNFSKLYNLFHKNSYFFYYEHQLEKIDIIDDISVYRFIFKPETFLLSAITKKDSALKATIGIDYYDPYNDVIYGYIHSKEYILTLLPIYNRKDRKTLAKMRYNEIWKEDD